MRSVFLPCLGWAGALQAIAPVTTSLESTARIIGIAGVLGTLTVAVYRLGVWRQQMEDAKQDMASQLNSILARMEQRLDASDHVLSALMEQRASSGRWRARTERRLEQLERTSPYAQDKEQ